MPRHITLYLTMLGTLLTMGLVISHLIAHLMVEAATYPTAIIHLQTLITHLWLLKRCFITDLQVKLSLQALEIVKEPSLRLKM